MSGKATLDAGLAAALDEAHAAFTARNPASLATHREASELLPGGNTRTVLFHAPFPLMVARGEGCRLWDVDGHEYVDFLGEFTAGLYGHSHPAILGAIRAALEDGINLGAHTTAETRLARAVRERFPSMELMRFTNSGTEANLMALAAALAHTGRRKVLVFEGGYHGGVLAFDHGPSPVTVPHEFVLARYNDAAGAQRVAHEHGQALAAILVEPLQGAGGCIPGDAAFLWALREAATETGAVLIFDEVMTSRLGPGGLQGELLIQPDVTTLGKYIGGGMSFGAFGGRAEIMERFDPRRPDALKHAGTFNNNVLSMKVGHAGLTQVFTPEAARALNARGEALRERLNGLCRANGHGHGRGAPLQFSGRGSMMAAHMTADSIRSSADVARGDTGLKELFFFDLLAEGIWLARRGFIALSLAIGDAECDRLAAAVERFLEARAELLAWASVGR
jgi:glutamate-1-semialdehyde 2,1-aminomutase